MVKGINALVDWSVEKQQSKFCNVKRLKIVVILILLLASRVVNGATCTAGTTSSTATVIIENT